MRKYAVSIDIVKSAMSELESTSLDDAIHEAKSLTGQLVRDNSDKFVVVGHCYVYEYQKDMDGKGILNEVADFDYK